jgi:hypothetical protein
MRLRPVGLAFLGGDLIVLRRTTAVGVAAVLSVVGLVGTAASSIAVVPVGTAILPPVYGDSVPRTDLVGSNGVGVGFTVARGSSVRPSFQYWSPTRGAVDSGISAYTATMAGNQAAVMTSGRSGVAIIHLVDLVSGAVREVPLGPSEGDTFVGTGDGFLIHVSTPNGVGYDHLQLMNGSTAFTANFPIPGYVQTYDSHADSRGLLVEWAEFNGGNGHFKLSYLDFATKKWTKLADVPEIGTTAMSAGQVAWVTGGVRIHRLSRGALGASASVYVAPVPVSLLALNGSTMAWESDSVGGSQSRITHVWTKVSGHAPVRVSAQAGEPTQLGTDFAVVSGSTLATAGVYRLHPGSSTLSTRLVAAGPDAPLSVTESAGRFLYQAPTSRTAVEQRAVTASLGTATPRVSISAPVTLASTSVVGVTPAASGGHTATYECGTACAVVVRDAAGVIRRIPWVDSVIGLSLSGNSLLVAAEHDGASGQVFYSRLYDLNSSASQVLEPYTDALSGRRIAFVSSDGSVTVRDLSGSVPVDTVVRPPGLPAATSQVSPQSTVVRFVGDWVLWSIPDDTLTGAETVAYHVPDATAVTLPVPSEVQLADGQAAFIAPGDRSVHLVDLATSTDTVIGRAEPETSNRQWLAMSDEVVAFVASDDSTHLVPLSGTHVVVAAPRVQGTVRATASSLVRPLRVQLDASRPVTSWRFIVADAHGQTVYATRGAAPDGGPRPVWSGRTTSGARVRDGVYTWRIVGSGPGGALYEGPGTVGASRGTVRLDTVAPRAGLRLPARTGHAALVIGWSATEHARFLVTVSKRLRVRGHWTWTAPRTWLRTSSGTARYTGTHVPYRLVTGETLRFAVTAFDAAGNASKIVRGTTLVH